MPYNMDMSGETPPKRLLDKGWRKLKIQNCTKETSKQSNEMFVFKLLDKETGYIDTVYAITEKGKRWILKSILEACGADASNWDIPDVDGKDVEGLAVHEPNIYINRKGDEVSEMQHKFIDFKMIAWDA